MQKFLFLKKDRSYVKILHQDIIYLETHKRCTKIVTSKGIYIVLSSLNSIQKKLPAEIFCQIHQSYIVSLAHLEKFDTNTASISGKELPIGRRYREALLNKVEVLNCDSGNISTTEYKIGELSGKRKAG